MGHAYARPGTQPLSDSIVFNRHQSANDFDLVSMCAYKTVTLLLLLLLLLLLARALPYKQYKFYPYLREVTIFFFH